MQYGFNVPRQFLAAARGRRRWASSCLFLGLRKSGVDLPNYRALRFGADAAPRPAARIRLTQFSIEGKQPNTL